jgi:predicted ATPase
MFRKCELWNFRSVRHVILDDMAAILALLGRNGVGKSNILKGVAWYAKSATSPSLVPVSASPLRPAGAPRILVEFVLDGILYRHDFLIDQRVETAGKINTVRQYLVETISVKAGDLFEVMIARSDEEIKIDGRDEILRIGGQTSVLSALRSVLSSEDAMTANVNRIFKFLSAIRYYGTNDVDSVDIAPFISLDSYTNWLNSYRQGQPGDSVLLRLIHMVTERPEQLAEFKSLLGAEGLGVISEIVVHRFGNDKGPDGKDKGNPTLFLIFFLTDEQSGPVRFEDLSFGTQRLLRILISLVFDNSSVLLVEQPEDGIHAGLTKKLFGILRANTGPSQILFATHSVVLLNQLKAEEVRLITKSEGATSVRALTSDERGAATAYLMEDGTMSDFLSLLESE